MGHSRFYLCDLQVHTPADVRQGYGDVGGREPNRAFADRLVQAHAEAGVEVMAASDHNRTDWYPLLREAGEKVGVFVFPALEFSANRCHLLAIWDRDDAGYMMAQRFLTTLWKPGEQPFEQNGDPRPVGQGQVIELAQRAIEHKALVFAPHSTTKDIGFFAKGVCTNRRDVIQAGLIAGYDVWGHRSADVLKNPSAEFGDRVPAWFMSGDVRQFADIGSRATYLKLGEVPTLEGIRQAFLMPETRIRLPDGLRGQWGHVQGARFTDGVSPTWPRIDSMAVTGGFHDKLDVRFGPGLNAVIGGKGTGKSTLIEILRHALHAGDPAREEARGNREHNFKANAEASIAFIDGAGDAYEIRRTGSNDAARLIQDGIDLGIAVPRRAPVRIFGQRELQALADRPEVLREFVAAQGGPAWSDAASSERALISKLRELDAELHGIEVLLSSLDEDQHELTDLTNRIQTATAKGAGDLIQQQAALGDADAKVRAVVGWPDDVLHIAQQFGSLLPAPAIPDAPRQQEEMSRAVADLGTTVTEAAASLQTAANRAKRELAAPHADWERQREDEKGKIERALADAGLTDPRELARMQNRARELQATLAELPQKRARAKEIGQRRSGLLQELGEVRRLKSRLVEAAARTLNERVGRRVRVRIDPLADKEALLRTLEQAVKGQSVRGEQLRALADGHTPLAIAQAIRESPEKVAALGCSAATATKLHALDSGATREVEEIDTPDRILVEVNLGEPAADDSWHEVTEVSPGQRATALLALALAGGREPLIIDQPEDDLDNRYIYDEVVKVLAEVCQSRQVIVATHNANIPILGDAEMVLILDAQAARGRVLACGGLEEPAVAEWSRKILEGGEAAFQARHRRYEAARST